MTSVKPRQVGLRRFAGPSPSALFRSSLDHYISRYGLTYLNDIVPGDEIDMHTRHTFLLWAALLVPVAMLSVQAQEPARPESPQTPAPPAPPVPPQRRDSPSSHRPKYPLTAGSRFGSSRLTPKPSRYARAIFLAPQDRASHLLASRK